MLERLVLVSHPHRVDPRLVRVDDAWLALPNPGNVPVEICAINEVPIEPAAIDEILTVLETATTLRQLADLGADQEIQPRLDRVVCTPDLHKGAWLPIVTVLRTVVSLIPRAVGNDINCGMRVKVTSLTADQVRAHLQPLERSLRHLFFEGGRRIGLTPTHREGLLREGLPGLLAGGVPPTAEAAWAQVTDDDHTDMGNGVHTSGFPAAATTDFTDWITSSGGLGYDSIIGSIGGGNHFAELQVVAAVHDGPTAHAWGLHPGRVVLMVHSGSLSLGHQANATGQDQARAVWPRALPLPANGMLPILLDERSAHARQRYLTALANAANFALGNRFFLALMLRAGLASAVGPLHSRLVYDAPHNLLWPGADGVVVHRKGATPAGGPGGGGQRPADLWGEPVIVPGSMGAASFILRGTGSPRALASACHGAGRRVPRGAAAKGSDADLDRFLAAFRVVTPLDHRAPGVASRRDIVAAWRRDLKEEAPWAYKDVGPIGETLRRGDVAHPVAELHPILTVKG